MRLPGKVPFKFQQKDCELGMLYKVGASELISLVITKMLNLADAYDCKIFTIFNGLPLIVSPNEKFEEVAKRFDETVRVWHERPAHDQGDNWDNDGLI